jgi:hypothetical protein
MIDRAYRAVALAAALTLGSGAVLAAEPVSGSFASSAKSATFLFDIDFEGTFSSFVFSEAHKSPGYDITSVLVNGTPLFDLIPVGPDYYSFDLAVLPGTVSIKVQGASIGGGSFTGSYTVTPVPEASAVAMTLAGLGLVGLVAARRRQAA